MKIYILLVLMLISITSYSQSIPDSLVLNKVELLYQKQLTTNKIKSKFNITELYIEKGKNNNGHTAMILGGASILLGSMIQASTFLINPVTGSKSIKALGVVSVCSFTLGGVFIISGSVKNRKFINSLKSIQ